MVVSTFWLQLGVAAMELMSPVRDDGEYEQQLFADS